MKIRIQSSAGWNAENRQAVIDACLEHDIPFIDRASVADPVMRSAGLEVLISPNNETYGMDDYVFFTHRGMVDLPFDRTIQGSQ